VLKSFLKIEFCCPDIRKNIIVGENCELLFRTDDRGNYL